ncbi:MAG: hypothetical protein RL307_192, partial [Pseudomonadota bacterium]
MWLPMPDGVLKTQLLHEWAKVIQLGTHELLALWGVNSGGQNPKRSAQGARKTSNWQPSRPTRAAREGRLTPTQSLREDRALALLFHASSHWEQLSESERGLLCELQSPHGTLFRWLDTQIHEHGPLPLAALQEGVKDLPEGQWLVQLVARTPDTLDNGAEELQHILLEIEKQDLDGVLADLALRASSDPEAYARFKLLSERRKTLKSIPYTVDPV